MLHRAIARSLTTGALCFTLAMQPTWGQTRVADTASSALPQGFTKVTITPAAGGGFVFMGAGLGTGKLISNRCKDREATCYIDIKASAAPKDGDDDDDKGCTIRVAPSWILSKDTQYIEWRVNSKNPAKGFKFDGSGIVLDDLTNFTSAPSIVGDVVRATVKKPGSVAGVVSYTIYLKQKGNTCDGYDPIIVNRDN